MLYQRGRKESENQKFCYALRLGVLANEYIPLSERSSFEPLKITSIFKSTQGQIQL